MKGFGKKNQSKKEITSKNKQKVNIGQLINKAFELQAQGKKLEAAKYYAYLIKQGIKDYRVFSNYGAFLNEIGKYEEAKLEEILSKIGNNIKLRIDANGSWGREIANRWADILKDNKNIDWLEQPLCVDDIDGLTELNKKIPIALDESLLKFPTLIDEWKGWQIRRPSQENNPVKLLDALENKKALISISTSFETGIGRRRLYHLSSLQLQGPTPKVPGLAMNNFPNSFLFLNEAKKIWDLL